MALPTDEPKKSYILRENKCLVELNFDFRNIKEEILQLVFPIGASYVTQTDVNPSTILGFGRWERVKGKLLVGLNEDEEIFNEIGKTGGEISHTLTQDELPDCEFEVIDPGHKHTAGGYNYGTDSGKKPGLCNASTVGKSDVMTTDSTKTRITVKSKGKDEPINIMNPYEVVGYMWKRTA